MQAKIFGPTFELFERVREHGFSHEEELELLMDCAESAAGESSGRGWSSGSGSSAMISPRSFSS